MAREIFEHRFWDFLRALRDLTPRDAVAAAVMAVFLYAVALLLDHPAVVAMLCGSAR